MRLKPARRCQSPCTHVGDEVEAPVSVYPGFFPPYSLPDLALPSRWFKGSIISHGTHVVIAFLKIPVLPVILTSVLNFSTSFSVGWMLRNSPFSAGLLLVLLGLLHLAQAAPASLWEGSLGKDNLNALGKRASFSAPAG